MDVILYLIAVAFTGLIVGALARLLLPGRDPMSILQTIMVGIAGGLAAGLFAHYVLDRDGAGFLLSLLFAVLVVYIVRKVRQRAVTERPGAGAHRP